MEENPHQPSGPDPTKQGLSFWAKHFPWLKGHQQGQAKRNAFCSFCRKSYREVGPLVEGPDEVYICWECVRLCDSILLQEQQRRAGEGNGSGKST